MNAKSAGQDASPVPIVPDAYYPLDLTNLPPAWQTKWIGDVVLEIQPGFASGEHNDRGVGVPHLRMFNITREGNIDVTRLKSVAAPKKTRIRKGEVLFTNTNSFDLVGKTAPFLLDGEWALSNHMTRIRLPPGWSAEFVARQLHLLWMLGYFRHRCTRHVNQASFGTQTLATSVPLIVAPIAEQRRIVEAIEAHFTQLDAAVAALERVRANLKRYRASVLKAACEGTVLPGLGSFRPMRLADVVLKDAPIIYGILQPGPVQESGVPYVRPTEIESDRIVLQSIRHTTPAIAAKYKRATLAGGDVIFTIVGTIGKVAIVPAVLDGANITQSSARLRPDEQLLSSAYLAICLRSPLLWKQVQGFTLGTAVQRLNLQDVREMSIPVPSRADQGCIVAEVERRLSVADTLAAEVEAGLKRCARMRQAILKKAFEGRLLPQHPSDLPVNEKLDRIRTPNMATVTRGRDRKGGAS